MKAKRHSRENSEYFNASTISFVGQNTSVPYVGVIFHKTWTTDAIRTILGRFGPWAFPHPWNPYQTFCYVEIGFSDCKRGQSGAQMVSSGHWTCKLDRCDLAWSSTAHDLSPDHQVLPNMRTCFGNWQTTINLDYYWLKPDNDCRKTTTEVNGTENFGRWGRGSVVRGNTAHYQL